MVASEKIFEVNTSSERLTELVNSLDVELSAGEAISPARSVEEAASKLISVALCTGETSAPSGAHKTSLPTVKDSPH